MLKDSRPFTVTGTVLARNLPARWQFDRRILIERAPTRDHVEWANKATPMLQHPTGFEFVWSLVPAHINIKSKWAIVIHLLGTDASSVQKRVEDTILPIILASLTAVNPDGQVGFKITRITDDLERQSASPFTKSGIFTPFDLPEQVDADGLALMSRIAATAEHDSRALDACRLFASAHELEEYRSNLEPMVSATLLAYFKVVEFVAQKVTTERPPQEAEYRQIIDNLVRKLDSTRQIDNKLSAIVEASRKVSESKGQSIRNRIEDAAQRLSLDDATTKAAVRFARFRNENLGHARAMTLTNRLEGELVNARVSARAFLISYLEFLAAGRQI
jgi:hypothetical protein